jgi:NTP pyrophosphatase (non-canonical NTP hydrolase)
MIIFPNNSQDLMDRATKIWGSQAQFDMAIGEIGELLSLVGRHAQGRATTEEWVSEISDVLIMVTQLALLFGKEDVEKRVSQKMSRLESIIEKEEIVRRKVKLESSITRGENK